LRLLLVVGVLDLLDRRIDEVCHSLRALLLVLNFFLRHLSPPVDLVAPLVDFPVEAVPLAWDCALGVADWNYSLRDDSLDV
jgi:hypothetical protein